MRAASSSLQVNRRRLAVAFDPEAKSAIAPFPHLLENPAVRVKEEERKVNPDLAQSKGRFSAALMTNNTHVSMLAGRYCSMNAQRYRATVPTVRPDRRATSSTAWFILGGAQRSTADATAIIAREAGCANWS